MSVVVKTQRNWRSGVGRMPCSGAEGVHATNALTGTTSEVFCWTLFPLYSMSLMDLIQRPLVPVSERSHRQCRVVLKNLFLLFFFGSDSLELLDAVWVPSGCISEQFGQPPPPKKQNKTQTRAWKLCSEVGTKFWLQSLYPSPQPRHDGKTWK